MGLYGSARNVIKLGVLEPIGKMMVLQGELIGLL